MCELGVFPIFLENDLSKVDKILGLMFFKSRKDFQRFKTAFSHLLLMFMFAWWNVRSQPLFIRVEEAVLWTQRFLTRKLLPKNRRTTQETFFTNLAS